MDKRRVLHIVFWLCVFCFPSCRQLKLCSTATFCNPVNIGYRFCLDTPSRREAADPSIVLFKDEYYLFVSKSGGYFHSTDLINWNLITTNDLPLENYAPTAAVIGDKLFFLTSASEQIFSTGDPKSGRWQLVNEHFPIIANDPMLFADDDGRVYYYYGSSIKEPIKGVELNPADRFNPMGVPVDCIAGNQDKYGWEQRGDYHDLLQPTCIEGAWMNKYKGKYYLQYASPGTQFKTYNDGVYVSDNPLGPFVLAEVNPFAYKPEGFAAGAGHGSTFQDKYGNYWHAGTVSASVKHKFERRLSLFPVFFDKDDQMSAYTGFGDYPVITPKEKVADVGKLFTGWMLLSYNKPVTTSSSLNEHPAQNAVNEDIRTYWSATTGDKGEFISVDLENQGLIKAVQINFAEQDTHILGKGDGIYYQYLLEYSNDGKTWFMLADKSDNILNAPHDYISLSQAVKARYVRLTNLKVPESKFAVSGLRVFGSCDKTQAAKAPVFTAERETDRRVVNIRWEHVPDATGYNIRYGAQKDKLYQNYIVYGKNEVTIRCLNVDSPYYFTVDAFNEKGVTEGKLMREIH